MVLKGADGIVFVADSQQAMEDANIESLENLKKKIDEQIKNNAVRIVDIFDGRMICT